MSSDKPVLKLDWATYQAAKYACEHWHYSGCVPSSKLVKIGVWEDKKFIGVLIFGVGACFKLIQKYGLSPNEGCELVRVALSDHQTQVTRIIAIALKMLKKISPGLRLIVSFADAEKGHHGGIYQGGNWVYTGRSASRNEYLFKGKRWHGRAFRHKYSGLENDPRVKIVKGSSKHRYLMPLDDEMRSKIRCFMKPYPKRDGSRVIAAAVHQIVEGGEIPTPSLQSKKDS